MAKSWLKLFGEIVDEVVSEASDAFDNYRQSAKERSIEKELKEKKEEEERNYPFTSFVKNFPKDLIYKIVDETYNELSRSSGNQPGFGEDEIFTFAEALMLSKYDPEVKVHMDYLLSMFFQKYMGPADFYERIVNEHLTKSKVGIEDWENTYQYLRGNHSWLKYHNAATNKMHYSYTFKSRFAKELDEVSYGNILFEGDTTNLADPYETTLSDLNRKLRTGIVSRSNDPDIGLKQKETEVEIIINRQVGYSGYEGSYWKSGNIIELHLGLQCDLYDSLQTSEDDFCGYWSCEILSLKGHYYTHKEEEGVHCYFGETTGSEKIDLRMDQILSIVNRYFDEIFGSESVLYGGVHVDKSRWKDDNDDYYPESSDSSTYDRDPNQWSREDLNEYYGYDRDYEGDYD